MNIIDKLGIGLEAALRGSEGVVTKGALRVIIPDHDVVVVYERGDRVSVGEA